MNGINKSKFTSQLNLDVERKFKIVSPVKHLSPINKDLPEDLSSLILACKIQENTENNKLSELKGQRYDLKQ